jgi:hypothetical protein
MGGIPSQIPPAHHGRTAPTRELKKESSESKRVGDPTIANTFAHLSPLAKLPRINPYWKQHSCDIGTPEGRSSGKAMQVLLSKLPR